MVKTLTEILGDQFKIRDKEYSDGEQQAPGYASRNASTVTMDMGNANFRGGYDEAIRIGLEELQRKPTDAMVHIGLMDAYTKMQSQSPENLAKSSYHARMAMLYGHHTGYAEKRLAINLEKEHKYHQALQLYSLILDTPGFHFTKTGCGNGIDFEARRQKALAKLAKASDTEDDVLFSPSEIDGMVQGIAETERREAQRQAEFERKMKESWEKLLRMK